MSGYKGGIRQCYKAVKSTWKMWRKTIYMQMRAIKRI